MSTSEVERLVSERAKQLDQNVTPDLVHVYEDAHSADGNALVIQIATRRPVDRKSWTQQRLRFAQALRDMLLQRGDDRYPVLEVYGLDEWADRNA